MRHLQTHNQVARKVAKILKNALFTKFHLLTFLQLMTYDAIQRLHLRSTVLINYFHMPVAFLQFFQRQPVVAHYQRWNGLSGERSYSRSFASVRLDFGKRHA